MYVCSLYAPPTKLGICIFQSLGKNTGVVLYRKTNPGCQNGGKGGGVK